MTEHPKHVEQKIEAKDSVLKDVTQVIVEHLTLGITRLPTDYASRIQNFLVEYLGTPGHPVPFGGRDADLASLDAWLADPHAPPYLLSAAPACPPTDALFAGTTPPGGGGMTWLSKVYWPQIPLVAYGRSPRQAGPICVSIGRRRAAD